MYADLVAGVEPAVVAIKCPDIGQSGSGFLISPTGHVLTNNHVVAQIRLVAGKLERRYSDAIHVSINGRDYPVSLVNDPSADPPMVYDYAILKVEGLASAPCVQVGDLGSVKRGDDVICLGFPLDFDTLIATHGIVSALTSRPSHVNALHQMRTVVSNALIQFGSSGGPMLHVPSRKVVGINTLKHAIHDVLSHSLRTWSSHPGAAAFPLIRDLVEYSLKYTYVGLHHAVSVEYALADPKWPK